MKKQKIKKQNKKQNRKLSKKLLKKRPRQNKNWFINQSKGLSRKRKE